MVPFREVQSLQYVPDAVLCFDKKKKTMAEERGVLPMKNTPIEDDYIIDWNVKLGSGVSGPVRLCTSRTTGEKYALKCLVDSTKSRTEAQNHFTCSGHPHIVSVVDAYSNRIVFPGEMRGLKRVLLVLELMEGGELFELIRSKKKFTEKEAANFTRQIALGLYHCHSFNIAHRDLKPENLLLKDRSENVVIKLADFGFAKVDRGDLVTPQFTPYYVSPQVLEAQKIHRAQRSGRFPFLTKQYTYDKSCDMWSLGVIIYIMLCGYPPFYSEVPRKQLSQGMKKKIMAGEYEFPEPEWSKITTRAKDVISRLLRVEPAQRMSVRDLLEDPWLNNEVKVPDIALHSPAIIANEEAFEEAMNAHSVQLTKMRLPDRIIMLKAVKKAQNPILQKRRVLYNVAEHASANPNEIADREKEGLAVKTLRDVIAFCILSPTNSAPVQVSPEEEFQDLVRKAIQHNPNSTRLSQALSKESWDGEKFVCSVDKRRLAKSLGDIVRKM